VVWEVPLVFEPGFVEAVSVGGVVVVVPLECSQDVHFDAEIETCSDKGSDQLLREGGWKTLHQRGEMVSLQVNNNII